MATNDIAPQLIELAGANNNVDTSGADRPEDINTEDILTTTKDWLKLNVGGTVFCTSKKTLRRYPDCILNELCSESEAKLSPFLDNSGALLIDRDPKYFSIILDYLRCDDFYLCSSICESAIIAEAKYFHLPTLVELIQRKIKAKQLELQATNVHRVHNLKNDELSSFLSSLSDGWKLCQILPNSNGSNFMVIVSKCFETPLTPTDMPFAPKAAKVFDSPKEPTKQKHKTKLKF